MKTEEPDISAADNDIDEGNKYLQQHLDTSNSISQQSRKLLTKIDLRLIPVMAVAYTFCFLDRAILNYASPMGLVKDLHLRGNEFSNVSSVFSASNTAFALLQGLFLHLKCPPSKLLAANVMLWGTFTALTACVNSYSSLLALRVLVGACEAAIVPCLQLILPMWYTVNEQTSRFVLWYTGLGLGQILGGLLSFAFQHMHDPHFASWKAMFILLGVLSALTGCLMLFLIPDTPMTARFLSETEKTAVLQKVQANKIGVWVRKVDWTQLLELAGDPQIYLLVLIIILLSSASGVVNTFSSTLLRNYGFTNEQSALLTIPGGFVSLVTALIAGFGAQRTGHRLRWISGLALLAAIGAGLMTFISVKNRVGMLVGLYLVYVDTATVILAWQLAAANVAGQSKRPFAMALCDLAFGVGTVIGPQTFRASAAPYYYPARLALFILLLLGSGCSIVLLIYYDRENRGRDLLKVEACVSNTDARHFESGDKTDRVNGDFRYTM